jgi:hypothetical protein
MRQDPMPEARGPLFSTGVAVGPALGPAPTQGPLPVRWTPSGVGATQGDLRGGDEDVTGAGEAPGESYLPGEPEPDAVAKGWVVPPGGTRVDAIFVLAGTSLGIGRVERATTPVWLNLDDLVNLDALGDPVDGLTAVEILMEDQRVIGAGWPDHFCDAVVEVLRQSAGRSTATPGSPAATAAAPAADADAVPAPPEALQDAPVPVPDVPEPVVPAPAPLADAPVPLADAPVPLAADPTETDAGPVGAGPTSALELEDVVYLGGYPGQNKRKKKCVVGMSRAALELKGPGDLAFRIGWDVVRTIEVQNSDEARFRMNTKVHRDASALVVECDQGITILLEARDCPTIALRTAIAQLLDGQPVVVV